MCAGMAADDVATRSQGPDLTTRQEPGPVDIAGRHEEVAAPAEHVEAVGNHRGARAPIVERQQDRQAGGGLHAGERLDRGGFLPETAVNGAKMGGEFVGGELVPRRVAAWKPARIVEAG